MKHSTYNRWLGARSVFTRAPLTLLDFDREREYVYARAEAQGLESERAITLTFRERLEGQVFLVLWLVLNLLALVYGAKLNWPAVLLFVLSLMPFSSVLLLLIVPVAPNELS